MPEHHLGSGLRRLEARTKLSGWQQSG
jgi:hypothetical protein